MKQLGTLRKPNAKFDMRPLLLVLLLLSIVSGSAKDEDLTPKIVGVPLVYEDASALNHEPIEQIVDDGQYLYLLFGFHDGIVQIYDTNGNYQKTIAFYSHQNGAFRIAVANGLFYVRDKRGNLYLFNNGEFDHFFGYQENEWLRKSIDFDATSTDYVVKMESVWRINGEEDICVVERPITALLNQRNQFMIVWGVLFCSGLYKVSQIMKRKNMPVDD